MNKKETKQQVAAMLNAGTPKGEVFKALSGGAVNDKQLALFIASHPDPRLFDRHDGKVNILVTIMFVQALLFALAGFGIGAKIGPTATWVMAVLIALIPLLFAYGFYRNHAGAYNIYIVLTLVQLPNAFKGFADSPIAASIGLLIGLGILAYVWYVRSLLFPDFSFITPKKINGNYVFSS